MSSPLRAFRKHQKKLIVFFGVLLMITFVLLGSAGVIDALTSPSQSTGDTVRVKWKGGSLTDNELYRLRIAHDRTSRFLLMLRQEATEAEGQPKVDITGIISAGGEQNLADLMMMTQKAEEMGVVIDDTTVLRFFIEASDNTIKDADQLESFYYSVSDDLPFQSIIGHMRLQLAAQALQRMLGVGLVASTPAENLDYFDRVNVRRTVELFPISVAKFVDQVSGQPSEQEVKELYEEGKNRYPSKFSPDPGFRESRQLKFSYFKGDESKLREAAEAKITDEQVAQYYEEHKEDYKRPSLPSANDGMPGTAIPPLQLPGLDDALRPDDPANGTTSNRRDSTTAPAKPADKTDGAAEKQEGAAGSSESDNAQPTGNSNASEDIPPTPTSNDSSSLKPSEQFRDGEFFVSLLDDAKTTASDAGTTEADPAKPAVAEQPKKDYWASGDTSNGSATQTTGKKDYWKLPGSGADSTGGGGSESNSLPKYRSLEEVAADIRRKLAEESVTEELKKTDSKFKGTRPFSYLVEQKLKSAEARVTRYARDRNRWERDKAAGLEKPEPLQPDWLTVADELQLVYGSTELLDAAQIRETEIGKTSDFTFAGGRPRQISFAEHAYTQETRLFQPQIFPQFGAQRYAFWQTEEKKDKIPTLEEARANVIAAWKIDKARQLAKADAEDKAAEAANSDKPFKELFGDDAFEPPPFSWMSSNNQAFGQGVSMTQSFVPGVESPGNTFHKDVAKLDLNETGIAMNQPEDTVFVVRVNQVSQFREYLDTQLTSAPLVQIGQQSRSELAFEAMRAIAKELDIEWIPRENEK